MASGEVKAVKQKSHRFTVKDLFYEVTLEERISKGELFRLMGFHPHNLTLFDIVSTETEDDLFHLREEINEVVTYQDTKLKRKPKSLDIVLAKKERQVSSNVFEYNRAIVIHLNPSGTHAEVYWVDAGGNAWVAVDTMKPVNEDIMKIPRLAYSVLLEDMYDTSSYILWTEYSKAMEALNKFDFTVELGSPNEIPGKLCADKKAKLIYKDSTKKIDLRDQIRELRTWEWERYSNLRGDDTDINENGKFGKPYRSRYEGSFPFPYVLTVKDKFVATVSRVLESPNDNNEANLRIVMLSESLYFNFFNVLHHQLARYAENIKPVGFFPGLDEPLMCKIAKKKKYKPNVKCLGRWIRALRCDKDMLYLFDFDEFVPFTKLEDEKDCEMRPLYAEFFKIPALCLTVRPTMGNCPLSVEEAKETFKVGKRYQFTVVKERVEESCLDAYDVSFDCVDKKDASVGLGEFLVDRGN